MLKIAIHNLPAVDDYMCSFFYFFIHIKEKKYFLCEIHFNRRDMLTMAKTFQKIT